MSNDLQTIEKWLAIDHEITLLTNANGYLLVQDEYAQFHIVQADLRGDNHRVTKIDLDGQPSVSLLQNISFDAAKDSEDQDMIISYDYFLPAKA